MAKSRPESKLAGPICTRGRSGGVESQTPVQRSSSRPARPFADGDCASSDRGLRRRRLLDGVGQPPARRVRARALPARAPARLLPALGQRRRRPLRRPLLPCLPGRALRGQPRLALPARAGPGRPARAPARPGPDLRRRRQRHQPARCLAGARDRRDPARGLGGRRRPLRPLGRLALLVRRGAQRLPRSAAAGRGPGPAALQQLRPLRARLRARPRLPRRCCGRGCAPATRREDGAALHFVGAELHRVVASRPAARGYRLDAVGGDVVEMQLATDVPRRPARRSRGSPWRRIAARRRLGGRRWSPASSPSAATTSPRARPTARSAS